MQLNDSQKAAISNWIKEGSGISDVQKGIQREFGLAMTYLDVRMLIDDLKLSVKDKVEEAKASKTIGAVSKPGLPGDAEDADPVAAGDDAPPGLDDAGIPGATGVSIEIDRLNKPGAVVSGSVVFSDGVKASWEVDTMGRMGLRSDKPGYRPSQADIQAFQQELSSQLRKRGF